MTNLLFAFPLSFFSKPFYKEVGETWRWKSFLYFLFLLLICWIIVSYNATYYACKHVHMYTDKISSSVIAQFPTIHFKNGVASTDKAGPHVIKIDDGRTIAIIDTGNKINNFRDLNALLLIQKDALLIKQSNLQVSTIYYPKNLNYTITSNDITKATNLIKQYACFSFHFWIYSFSFIFFYIFFLITVFIYSLVGLLLSAIFKCKLTYPAILSLTFLALTPTVVLFTILTFFNVYIPYGALIYIFLSLGYVFFSVKSNVGNNEKQLS